MLVKKLYFTVYICNRCAKLRLSSYKREKDVPSPIIYNNVLTQIGCQITKKREVTLTSNFSLFFMKKIE